MVLPALALMTIFALVPSQASVKPSQSQWEEDIRRFEAEDVLHPPAKGGIVFVGSSSIVRWTTLKQDFPNQNVINRGFGGSEVSDSVRFALRIVTPYQPKMVVFFAGTNDIAAGKSAETVAQNYKEFVNKIRHELPKVKIAYIAISPAPSRWKKLDEMKKANRLIQRYSQQTRGLLFVDTFSLMLTATGGPRPELFVTDQLHLSRKGYAIWVKAIKPLLPKGA